MLYFTSLPSEVLSEGQVRIALGRLKAERGRILGGGEGIVEEHFIFILLKAFIISPVLLIRVHEAVNVQTSKQLKCS